MIVLINSFLVLPAILMASLLGLGIGDVSFSTFASCLGCVTVLVVVPVASARKAITEGNASMLSILVLAGLVDLEKLGGDDDSNG